MTLLGETRTWAVDVHRPTYVILFLDRVSPSGIGLKWSETYVIVRYPPESQMSAMRVFFQEGIISLKALGMATRGRHDVGFFFFEVLLEAFHNIISFYQSVLRRKFLPLPANSPLWITDRETITGLGSEHRITEPGDQPRIQSSFVCNMTRVGKPCKMR
jgi:hypothetical protein